VVKGPWQKVPGTFRAGKKYLAPFGGGFGKKYLAPFGGG
jgi:hypothetical protein